MKPYDKVPFTNSIGQIIQPGDRVVIVTTGYSHQIKTRVGTFLGTRGEGRYIRTVCQVTYERRGWVDKGGKPTTYGKHAEYGTITTDRAATYFCNRLFKLA